MDAMEQQQQQQTSAEKEEAIVAEQEEEDEKEEKEQQQQQQLLDQMVRGFLENTYSVSTQDLDMVSTSIQQNLEHVCDIFETKGRDAYLEYKMQQRQQQRDKNKNKTAASSESSSGDDDALFEDDDIEHHLIEGDGPRSYQTSLFELAKKQNTIIHLPTGAGKTLISLLLCKEFDADFAKGKQTVFLVPSVALVVQQTATIQANLPYTVGMAYGETVDSATFRPKLATCNILVATHGACQELLNHYGDLFYMEKWNLLIFDECHHCTGKSPYVGIMEFYHRTKDKSCRPHVLGLTASPLINVKKGHSVEQLEQFLTKLEDTLDAKIASVEDLGDGQYDDADDDTAAKFLTREPDEVTVRYSPMVPPFFGPMPDINDERRYAVHRTRRKELRQFASLYEDLGPLPLSLYANEVLKDLVPNSFENETDEEFEAAQRFLQELVVFCDTECSRVRRSNKLAVLEESLLQEIHSNRVDMAVGVVFVQRRITALALKLYFDTLCTTSMPIDDDRIASPVAHGIATDDNSQFGDAVPDHDPFSNVMSSVHESLHENGSHSVKQDNTRKRIRCGVLVRKPNSLFKSLRPGESTSSEVEHRKGELTHLHQVADIRSVLKGLRSGDINLLVASSMVEEGVDVQACSFVVAFDSLQSIKSYIQMRGRARQENAKFFLFQKEGCLSSLSLEDAKEIESKIRAFTSSRAIARKNYLGVATGGLPRVSESDFATDEVHAAKSGFYIARDGQVNLNTSKSLLYRVALRQPIDSASRSSRESLEAHLPFYENNADTLCLPAYVDSTWRTIQLPSCFSDKPKKERQNILALMACVRLHRNGLLNERLLPLSRNDFRQRIVKAVYTKHSFPPIERPLFQPLASDPSIQLFQRDIVLEGDFLSEARQSLKSEGRRLTLVSNRAWPDIQTYVCHHEDFGNLSCALGGTRDFACSFESLKTLHEFFALLMNSRWKRRTKDYVFRPREPANQSHVVGFYAVGCTDNRGQLDFHFMEQILRESRRHEQERKDAVQLLSDSHRLSPPRLWCPSYEHWSTYICYGPAGMDANAEFPPSQHENVQTFLDYFQKRRKIANLEGSTPLYKCQRLWKLPRAPQTTKTSNERQEVQEYSNDVCPNLNTVFLPKCLCVEVPFLANAALALETIILPQFLFHCERHYTAARFVELCCQRFPPLGNRIRTMPLARICTLLSAKSSRVESDYERLEWLGDAVLQLVLTDAIMNSTYLKKWIVNFHEGDLTIVRSELCSNSELSTKCRLAGLHDFILTRPLERGLWTPSSLENDISKLNSVQGEKGVSEKTCADLMEAILGLVFCHGESDNGANYHAAFEVADSLKITIPGSRDFLSSNSKEVDIDCDNILFSRLQQFTGYKNFKNPVLFEEALTHPTDPKPGHTSYQRLEWIGDAVVCLAARSWIFTHFPAAAVGEMVTIEATMVSNETLALLALLSGIFKFLNHRDPSLPRRFEDYEFSIKELKKGLWSTNPPKPMADILESLVGAIHTDGGFVEGQRASLMILASILQLYEGPSTEAFLRYPRRDFLQLLGGDIFSFSKSRAGELSLPLETICPPLAGKIGVIVSVDCLGHKILSVADYTDAAATNRACALILEVLKQNSSLADHLIKFRRTLCTGVQ